MSFIAKTKKLVLGLIVRLAWMNTHACWPFCCWDRESEVRHESVPSGNRSPVIDQENLSNSPRSNRDDAASESSEPSRGLELKLEDEPESSPNSKPKDGAPKSDKQSQPSPREQIECYVQEFGRKAQIYCLPKDQNLRNALDDIDQRKISAEYFSANFLLKQGDYAFFNASQNGQFVLFRVSPDDVRFIDVNGEKVDTMLESHQSALADFIKSHNLTMDPQGRISFPLNDDAIALLNQNYVPEAFYVTTVCILEATTADNQYAESIVLKKYLDIFDFDRFGFHDANLYLPFKEHQKLTAKSQKKIFMWQNAAGDWHGLECEISAKDSKLNIDAIKKLSNLAKPCIVENINALKEALNRDSSMPFKEYFSSSHKTENFIIEEKSSGQYYSNLTKSDVYFLNNGSIPIKFSVSGDPTTIKWQKFKPALFSDLMDEFSIAKTDLNGAISIESASYSQEQSKTEAFNTIISGVSDDLKIFKSIESIPIYSSSYADALHKFVMFVIFKGDIKPVFVQKIVQDRQDRCYFLIGDDKLDDLGEAIARSNELIDTLTPDNRANIEMILNYIRVLNEVKVTRHYVEEAAFLTTKEKIFKVVRPGARLDESQVYQLCIERAFQIDDHSKEFCRLGKNEKGRHYIDFVKPLIVEKPVFISSGKFFAAIIKSSEFTDSVNVHQLDISSLECEIREIDELKGIIHKTWKWSWHAYFDTDQGRKIIYYDRDNEKAYSNIDKDFECVCGGVRLRFTFAEVAKGPNTWQKQITWTKIPDPILDMIRDKKLYIMRFTGQESEFKPNFLSKEHLEQQPFDSFMPKNNDIIILLKPESCFMFIVKITDGGFEFVDLDLKPMTTEQESYIGIQREIAAKEGLSIDAKGRILHRVREDISHKLQLLQLPKQVRLMLANPGEYFDEIYAKQLLGEQRCSMEINFDKEYAKIGSPDTLEGDKLVMFGDKGMILTFEDHVLVGLEDVSDVSGQWKCIVKQDFAELADFAGQKGNYLSFSSGDEQYFVARREKQYFSDFPNPETVCDLGIDGRQVKFRAYGGELKWEYVS